MALANHVLPTPGRPMRVRLRGARCPAQVFSRDTYPGQDTVSRRDHNRFSVSSFFEDGPNHRLERRRA